MEESVDLTADAYLTACLAADAYEVLVALGDTVTQVAHTLRNKGIKGFRKSAFQCPLAEYLKQQFPEATLWRVNVGAKKFGMGEPFRQRLPEPCADFVTGFDAGLFSYLDALNSDG